MEKPKNEIEQTPNRDISIQEMLKNNTTPLLPIEHEWMTERVELLEIKEKESNLSISEMNEIKELKMTLKNSKTVDYPSANELRITLGSQVTLEGPDGEELYIVTGHVKDDIGEIETARITSDLGRAMLGKTVGEMVQTSKFELGETITRSYIVTKIEQVQ